MKVSIVIKTDSEPISAVTGVAADKDSLIKFVESVLRFHVNALCFWGHCEQFVIGVSGRDTIGLASDSKIFSTIVVGGVEQDYVASSNVEEAIDNLLLWRQANESREQEL